MITVPSVIPAALRAEFGPGFDLSTVDFYDIQHTIALAMFADGRGDWDECWDLAERPAQHWDGRRTPA
jgi:hypothetical protein